MEAKYREILKNTNVLLAEDSEQLRVHFKDVLSLYVDKVYEASDGEEALEIFRNNTIDIIFSDIQMPNMDGLELSKKIRQINENIPIVIISAYSHQEVLLEFIKLHLVEYIIKPIKHQPLLDTLEKCAKILYDKSLLMFKLSEDCTYDLKNKILKYDDRSEKLTVKESAFLELLIKNHNKLVTKDIIEYEIYSKKPMGDTALKNLTFKLRKKLPPKTLNTVGTHGYMLKAL